MLDFEFSSCSQIKKGKTKKRKSHDLRNNPQTSVIKKSSIGNRKNAEKKREETDV